MKEEFIDVVLLPTKRESTIGITNGKLYFSSFGSKTNDWANHDLYFIGQKQITINELDKQLKKGCYFESYKGLIKIITNHRVKTMGEYREIIATTDESLVGKTSYEIEGDQKIPLFPRPSNEFIELFVNKFNIGKPLTKVLVEFEKPKEPKFDSCGDSHFKSVMFDSWLRHKDNFYVKINPDNTINIINPFEMNITPKEGFPEPTVKLIAKHFVMTVVFEGVEYEAITSEDTKNLYEIHPEPKSRVEIENIIRNAAWNGEIENLD